MSDLTFASFAQGPLGEAIRTPENMGVLPAPTFTPAVTLIGPGAERDSRVPGPAMRLLGPGDVAGLAAGSVVRTDPPAGASDIEPNYLAAVEVVPVELPWVLTPARPAAGRLRPWLVLVVLDAANAPLVPAEPLRFVEADVAELPDLRDSWGWVHVQGTTGSGILPGGGEASRAAIARLVCPRRLAEGVTYRACLVPAFASGVAAGLSDPMATDKPNEPAWNVDVGGTVRLPVYHQWTFTTGPGGDFEQLVTRLQPADPESLRVSSARPVDVRAPWPGDVPLSDAAQLLGVQGALKPFSDPPIPEPSMSPAVAVEFDRRLRAQVDAPAQRLLQAPADDSTGGLAPPLYGGRHVSRELIGAEPAWLAQLNASISNRIAAGLGAEYVRSHQEDLMARAWEQVGAIREANRRRAVVELTTEVAEKVHDRHVAPLLPGEMLALAAPAGARTRTTATTTLAMEVRMSRLTDGAATSAFARRVRPAGKLARQTGVSVNGVVPRALTGDVAVPAGAPVIPMTPPVDPAAVMEVVSEAAASQLVVMSAMARVAGVNGLAGGDALAARIDGLRLGDELMASIGAGDLDSVASALAGQVETVTQMTSQVLEDMSSTDNDFGSVSVSGVPVEAIGIAGRVAEALRPGDSHRAKLASQTFLPGRLAAAAMGDEVMACPDFPVPTALALLESDPEWFLPGLGALAANRVALLQQNAPFIESYLVGMNHEMMRELLWREYPTDRRGTPFTRFWPRPGGSPDIQPIHTWTDSQALGRRLLQADALSVLLVRGDVLRRYPGTVVTAVRSAPPDESGRLRPDPVQPALAPTFAIRVDEATTAYAFTIPTAELTTPASAEAPGWFFVFAEHSFRIRFGFDEPPPPDTAVGFATWNDAVWPSEGAHPAFVPVVRGHAIAGLNYGPPSGVPAGAPQWNRDAADIARITLQRPFRVAIQADVLLHPAGGA
jgi:hypothetical protein